MRRLSVAFALACLLLAALPPAAAGEPAPPPRLQARAAALTDLASGRELFAQNATARLYPASTTKILTALVALRLGHLDDWVTVSPTAAAVGGSSLDLRAGDRLRLRDLLYGLMLVSGNDAAEAVAEAVSGSEAAFVAQMNATAAALGATGSHFTNPSGLPDPGHYTTAHDLALIARAAMNEPGFAQLVATRAHILNFADGRRRQLINENQLLGRDGVDGVKTGYTEEAGHTYVASASRGGLHLIAVVLDDTKNGKYTDALALLQYGFAAFQPLRLLAPGEPAAQSQVMDGGRHFVQLVLAGAGPLVVPVRAGEDVAITTTNPEVVRAPVRAGSSLGSLRVAVDGELVLSRPLVAASGVEAAPAAAAPAAPEPAPTLLVQLLNWLGINTPPGWI